MKTYIILALFVLCSLANFAQKLEGKSNIGSLNLRKPDTNAKPTIKWENPKTLKLECSSSSFDVCACIQSDIKVTDVKLFVNGVERQVARGYIVRSCAASVNENISLNAGDNSIYIVATNAIGSTISETAVIRYEPLATNDKKLKKIALVLGNANYPSSPLRNPVNDAETMSNELENIGFSVKKYTDCDYKTMKKAITEFSETLGQDKNSVGLFYYAGHGIQIKGENYLVPIDAQIQKEADISIYAVDINGLLKNLEVASNSMNIIILDACRNNPFVTNFRGSVGNGLASMNAPLGTIVAFATSPGSVAVDGSGQNGLFTQELVKAMKVKGLRIEDVFKKVTTQVAKLSNKQQIPWQNSSLGEGDFYFRKK